MRVVLQPGRVGEARCIAQSDRGQDPLRRDALVSEVVNRETDALIGHALRLIELEQQDWNQSRVPVVAVNDLRPFAGSQHELPRRSAEERKPRNIIITAVQRPTLEEVVLRMGSMKKHLRPSTQPNHTVQWTAAVNQGTQRCW